MRSVRLFLDEGVEIDVHSIVSNLNNICKGITFSVGSNDFKTQGRLITHPDTYQNLDDSIKKETESDLFALLITTTPYENNFFFNSCGNLVILSLFAWDYLTTLPMSNGVVFFIADFLALQVDNSFRHHLDNDEPKPECIYDFGWNKAGVDIGMRSSLICPECIERISSLSLDDEKQLIFSDLKLILNDLGNGSKWETDIIQYWKTKHSQMQTNNHPNRNQVFISYSHEDSKWLKRLKVHLKPFERNSVVHVWDDTQIRTGQEWRKEIENALNHTKLAVLLFSADFLASDFIANNELPPLLEAAQNEGAAILPIILKPCGIDKFPSLSKFQAVNAPSKTLVEMSEGEQERFLLKLTDDILNVLDE